MTDSADPVSPSGVEGLDNILRGGFPQKCLHLVTGAPGTGKTTLAMQFLLEGVQRGERCLYITLSESRKEIEKVARSRGWVLAKLQLTELIPSEHDLSADAQLTVFNPSELELGETPGALIAAVNEHRPQRLVIDSLSELRLIAQNALRYRRQVLALKLEDRAKAMEAGFQQHLSKPVDPGEPVAMVQSLARRSAVED